MNHSRTGTLKIDTVFWIIAAFLTLYYSDLIIVLKVDHRVNIKYFYASLAVTSIPIAIACYLILYLSFMKNVHSDDWEISAPYAIPMATASTVVAGILWNVSLWDVYRFYTPIILFLLFMGLVMTISILPPWNAEKKRISNKPHHTD